MSGARAQRGGQGGGKQAPLLRPREGGSLWVGSGAGRPGQGSGHSRDCQLPARPGPGARGRLRESAVAIVVLGALASPPFPAALPENHGEEKDSREKAGKGRPFRNRLDLADCRAKPCPVGLRRSLCGVHCADDRSLLGCAPAHPGADPLSTPASRRRRTAWWAPGRPTLTSAGSRPAAGGTLPYLANDSTG